MELIITQHSSKQALKFIQELTKTMLDAQSAEGRVDELLEKAVLGHCVIPLNE